MICPKPTTDSTSWLIGWKCCGKREIWTPFPTKPTLVGDAKVGGTVTCQPNLKGVTDVRYYWFADGYPLTYGASDSWKITSAEAGKKLRCMVKAVGARSMPEAWSAGVAIAE